MEFTKENVEKCWEILNKSQNVTEKKQADTFLTNFQKSSNCFEICNELFKSNDINSKIASAFILYQIIRGRVQELSTSKDEFSKLKKMFFENILPNLSNLPELVVQRMCYSVSILILGGILTYWQDCIEDILKYSTESEIKLYYAILILSNLNFEYSFIVVNQIFGYKLKDVLIDKKDSIKNFICSVFENADNIRDNNLKSKILDKVIEMTQAWVKFDLNVLTMQNLAEKFIKQINEDNIEKISELLCESISNSKFAKIYSYFPNYEEDEEHNDIFKKIFDRINPVEINSLNNIITIIGNFIANINNNTNNINKNDILLTGIANIFASISENFVYLFFIKNELSQKLLEMLFYFITLPKRKISYKFFETICEMREFINSFYRFANLTVDEKKEFISYLLKITESIMVNSKLKTLDVNYDLMLKKDILCLNLHPEKGECITNENDIEIDPNEVTVTDYRKNAEDVFYNIFIILVSNFGEEGANIFLNKIMNIFTTANINDASILKDANRLLAVETAFFVMRSITESFEVLNISYNAIIVFTQYILNSELINNAKMVVNFLLFLDKASAYLTSDVNVYKMTIAFLLKISNNNILEKIATLIVYNITMFAKCANVDIFNAIYDIYFTNYDNFNDIASTSNLSFALCCSLHNVSYQDDKKTNAIAMSLDDIAKYYSMIMSPATQRIKKLCEYIKSGNCDAKVRLEILKNYRVHQNVLEKANEINSEFFDVMFNSHFNDTFAITQEIFAKMCVNENTQNVMSELTNFYIKAVDYLKEKSLRYFDPLTKLMISSLEKSHLNYKCLIVLKTLFSSYAKTSTENNTNISNAFFTLSKQMCISIINEQKSQIEMMKIFAEFFYVTFSELNLQNITNDNLSILYDIISIFIEGMKTFSEMELIKTIMKSFSSFISNDYIPREVINAKLEMILFSVFNSVDTFNSFAIKELFYLCSYSIAFDKLKFIDIIRNILLSEKFAKTFDKPYIDLICEYLETFGERDSKLERIITIIVEIKQDKSQLSTLNFFGLEIARIKIGKKNS